MRLILVSLVFVSCCGLFSPQVANAAAQVALTCPVAVDNRAGSTRGSQFAGVQIISNPPNTSDLLCVVSGGEQVFFVGRAGGTSSIQLANLEIHFDIHDSPSSGNPINDRLRGRHLAVHNGNLTRIDCQANPVGTQFPIDNFGEDKLLTFAMRQGGQINRFWTYIPAPVNNQLQPLTIYQAPLLTITKNWVHSSSADVSSTITTSSNCSGFNFTSEVDRDGRVTGGGNLISAPLYPGEKITISEDVPEGYVSQLICDGELIEQKSTGTITYDVVVPTDLEDINEQACEFNSHKIVEFNLRKVWFGLTDLSVDTISLTESIVFGDSVPVNSPVIANLQQSIISGEPIALGAPITVNETHSENWFDSGLQCTSDATAEVFSGNVNAPFLVPSEVNSVLNCTLVTGRLPASLRVNAAQWNGPADGSSATITLSESTGGNQETINNIPSGMDGGVFVLNEPVNVGDFITIGVVAGKNWSSDVSRCLYPGPAGQPPIVIDDNDTFRVINETGGKTIFCDVIMTRKSAFLQVSATWDGVDDGSMATLQILESAGDNTTPVLNVAAGEAGFFIVDEPVFSGAEITLNQTTGNNWRNDGFNCSLGASNTTIPVDASGTFTVPADADGQAINCSTSNTLAPFRTVVENQFTAINVGEIFDVTGSNGTNTYAFSMQGNPLTDNALFTIDAATGIVTFINAPDFEMPDDADADNTYELQVTVTDNNGNRRVIFISITVSNDSVNECAPGIANRLLPQEPGSPQWYLLSVPCNVPANTTFGQLLDPLRDSSDWDAYYYNTTLPTPDYEQITAESVVPSPDVGFWFISIETLTLSLPEGSTLPTPSFGHEVEQTALWNLLGNPTASNTLYADWTLSNESTPCSGNSACTPDQAQSNNIDWVGFVFNHYTGAYKRLVTDGAGQQVVMPWDGYWLLLNNNAGETVDPWQVQIPRTINQYIFVTDEAYSGAQVGGFVAANGACQAAALCAGLPGEYKAWLSDGNSSPSVNFTTMPQTPYLRVDGALVADGYSALASPSGIMQAPVSLTSTFADASDAKVWTNTRADGTASVAHCNQWSSAAGDGDYGRASQTGIAWTHSADATESCASTHRLYCVGQ